MPRRNRGRARRVLEAATEWAANRRQFGQPVGRFQGVGFRLADMATELEAAELLTLRAAGRLDRGAMTDADAAMAKLYASEMLGRVTDAGRRIAMPTRGGSAPAHPQNPP